MDFVCSRRDWLDLRKLQEARGVAVRGHLCGRTGVGVGPSVGGPLTRDSLTLVGGGALRLAKGSWELDRKGRCCQHEGA